MTNKEHADQKQDPRYKCVTFYISVADISGEEQDHNGCGAWQQPCGLPEVRQPYTEQIRKDSFQEL